MDYYKLLQLEKEPFSNSPDPDYFFQSEQHLGCLQKLELALRLKRGLNVVIGDVGTGKTTLCRQLIRSLSGYDGFECHLVLDPAFDAPLAFLQTIHALFHPNAPNAPATETELKETIQQLLFTKGVDQHKTIVLIIDEGQKMTGACVEILRELLNYETNTFKLLQIVIFAQLEFEQILESRANFADRINLLHHLGPMHFRDTHRMVQHRIKLSSADPKPRQLFTLPAMWAIYRFSKGYPRKIIHLCHQSILAMLIQNRTRVGWATIVSCKKRLAVASGGDRRAYWPYATLAFIAALALVALLPSSLPMTSRDHALPPLNPAEPNPLALKHDVPNPDPMALPQKANTLPETPSETALATAASPTGHTVPSSPLSPEDVPNPVSKRHANPQDPDANYRLDRLPPQILGQLIVQPGDTLEELASSVYGSHSYGRLKAVILANPHIQNPNSISIGDIIKFPLMVHASDDSKHPSYWIILDEFSSLPPTMQRLAEISESLEVPLQMIPHWHPESSLNFSITVRGFFENEAEAINYSRTLPDSIMRNGRVISSWPEETRFYADPYKGGKLHFPINDARQ
ncbi:MAG: AAA family ATPase [Desulfobacteraceae bacterium]